ncbi:hypothetical protein KP509_18G076700 [Ceratopteris richardii]|uniref:Uncharacterized protein n=1 Tax=Ceratopteris richardii TaxID=49495 RepID=A0A8T2SQZ0_CERRI|nr:hypothetical protein KP509_18G076700 [Ceratopteris richardii]
MQGALKGGIETLLGCQETVGGQEGTRQKGIEGVPSEEEALPQGQIFLGAALTIERRFVSRREYIREVDCSVEGEGLGCRCKSVLKGVVLCISEEVERGSLSLSFSFSLK